MRFIAVLLLGALAASPCCRGVIIQTGQTYTWNFTLSPGGTPNAGATFAFDDKLDTGERLRLTFYENSVDEAPLLISETVGNSSGVSGFFMLGFASNGFFQDGQGIFTATMVEGSINLISLSVCTNIDGVNYYARVTPPSVPEPAATAPGIALAALGAVLFRRRRAKAGPGATDFRDLRVPRG